jgi:hypothetical protein
VRSSVNTSAWAGVQYKDNQSVAINPVNRPPFPDAHPETIPTLQGLYIQALLVAFDQLLEIPDKSV